MPLQGGRKREGERVRYDRQYRLRYRFLPRSIVADIELVVLYIVLVLGKAAAHQTGLAPDKLRVVSRLGGPGVAEGILLHLVEPVLDARRKVTIVGIQRRSAPDDSQVLAHGETI